MVDETKEFRELKQQKHDIIVSPVAQGVCITTCLPGFFETNCQAFTSVSLLPAALLIFFTAPARTGVVSADM